MELNTIKNQDCITYLQSLPDESINSIIIDPPYMGVVKEEWDNQWANIDEYVQWCNQWIEQSHRVLKKSGTVFIFGWSYQLSKLIPHFEQYNFQFKQDIVIWKGIQSAAGRTSNKLKMFPTTTEHLHFYYKDSTTFIKTLLQEKQEQYGYSGKYINEYLGKASNGGGSWSVYAGKNQKGIVEPTREDWEKLDILFGGLPPYEDMVYKFNIIPGITDVFDDINFYDKGRKVTKIHPTQKPLDLMRRVIKCATNPNDIVLDFFMGSGSTAVACKQLGRNFVGCEMDSTYCDKAIQWVDSIVPETPNEFISFV